MRNFSIKGWDIKTIKNVLADANKYYEEAGEKLLETVEQFFDFALSKDLDIIKISSMAETRKATLRNSCRKI